MDEKGLLREMESQNRWWAGGAPILAENIIERDIYRKVSEELEKKEVTGLVGLRRVGKTTLMKQLIKDLIEKGTKPENVLYFSFDMLGKDEFAMKRVLDVYFRHVLQEAPGSLVDKVYIFFDEVQKVMEWGEEMKSFHDKGYMIKFFVSGSSSMNVLKGSGESLVGRIIMHKMFPFSFREFLAFNGIYAEKSDMLAAKLPRNSEKMLAMFERYAKLGGFPELYELPGHEIKSKLKTYVDLTFYRDVVNLFEIKRPDVLEGIFASLLNESGSIVNYRNLSSSLGTRFETVKSYIEYMSCSFLVASSRFFSKSRRSLEKNPKIYVSSHAFMNLSGTREGLKMETMAFNHCTRLREEWALDGIFYWRDRKDEVDMVLTRKDEVIPVEVKYSERPGRLRGMTKFMKKFGVGRGIIVTKDLLEERKVDGKTVLFIPLWLFLLSG